MSDENSSDSSAEQRLHDRAPVTLVVEYDGADDFVNDYTENLSSGGIFINTTRQLEIGTEVKLMLSFPGLIEPIAIAGVVRWLREDGSDSHGVGLEFVNYEGTNQEELEELIARVASRDPDVISKVISVLVVEDNPHVARLIRDGLVGSGQKVFGDEVAFSFRMAHDGQHALELLEEHSFDALIVDIYLPVLDGASLITQVRASEAHKTTPIIGVSAGGESARQAALSAGANKFLDKPMRLREVISTLQQLLTL